jgi:hypothetical protein
VGTSANGGSWCKGKYRQRSDCQTGSDRYRRADVITMQLALYWLNSLIDVPSALLVNRLEDLHDGAVLCDVARELQVRLAS